MFSEIEPPEIVINVLPAIPPPLFVAVFCVIVPLDIVNESAYTAPPIAAELPEMTPLVITTPPSVVA